MKLRNIYVIGKIRIITQKEVLYKMARDISTAKNYNAAYIYNLYNYK